MSRLSQRGEQLIAHAPMPAYIREHFTRQNQPDYVPLCIAENVLVWELLQDRFAAAPPMPLEQTVYQDVVGCLQFRKKLARFLSTYVWRRPLDADRLVTACGVGTILEMLFYLIGDPSDHVLIPTPSYAGFWPDLEVRDQLRVQPVERSAADGFKLKIQSLEQAYMRADGKVAALLLTSPDNPLGTIYSPAELEDIAAWTEKRNIHLVMDEIYALSCYGATDFTSLSAVLDKLPPRIHLLWGFSKDFALSGLRCGVLYSENEAVIQGFRQLAYWGVVSSQTQWHLEHLLDDDAFLRSYIEKMQKRLAHSFEITQNALNRYGVAFHPAEAGFFVFADFRPYLKEQTWQGETAFWLRQLNQSGVSLTPGASCRSPEPGWLRICFGSQPPEKLAEALERLLTTLSLG